MKHKMKSLSNYFRNGKVYIWKEKFTVIKSKRILPNAFVNIQDKNEITVIIDQSKIKDDYILEISKDWKVLTLDIVFPFNVVGATAKISNTLAKAKVSILPIAAYSRDHFLIKEKDLTKAKKALESLGLKVIEKK